MGSGIYTCSKQTASSRNLHRNSGAPYGDEVLQGLGHLEALDVEVAQVQEVVDPLVAVAATAFLPMVVRLCLHSFVHKMRHLLCEHIK